MSPSKRWPLIVVGVLVLASPMFVYVPQVLAQSATTPKFEVASIRAGCGNVGGSGAPKGGGAVPSPGRFYECGVLRAFIQAAYVRYANGRDNRTPPGLVPIEGGPDWARSDRYQINAKPEGNPRPEMIQGPMLQALLEDRFKLKIRRETRDVPVYALIAAKGGPKLQKFKEGSCTKAPPPPAPGQKLCGFPSSEIKGPNLTVEVHGMTLEEFSKMILNILDRPVVDKTGITGLFDFHLEFSPDETTPGFHSDTPADGPTDRRGPSIFTAVQEQLGLKLESAKGSREFLVIDHVERPSEN